MSKPPFPDFLWDKIVAFMADEKTGNVLIGFHEGRVKDYKLEEFGKVPRADIDKQSELCAK